MRKWRAWNTDRSLANRACRFSNGSVLHYRPVNELEWQEGRLENISASGVLFRPEGPMDPAERGTPFELSFTVPMEVAGDGATHVLSRAYTARTIEPTEPDAPPAVAVRMVEYMLPLEDPD